MPKSRLPIAYTVSIRNTDALRGRRREVNDAELEQATRELNACVNEVVHYMNTRSECFIVNVGAFEIQFDLEKIGKPKEEGVAK